MSQIFFITSLIDNVNIITFQTERLNNKAGTVLFRLCYLLLHLTRIRED